LNIENLQALYTTGAEEITLTGDLVVARECEEGVAVIWRTEAVATDSQIALYGPKPGMPPLTKGHHPYVSSIPLLEKILPDGWVVRIIATCPGETPETVVAAALVQVMAVGNP
jgi:hypothetical protein